MGRFRKIRVRSCVAAVVLTVGVCGSAAAQTVPAVATPVELTSALASWTAANPATSALVWRLDESGPVTVLSYKADIPRRPASTMKVVTAASALMSLGPDFRFETHLYAGANATQNAGTLTGPIYLKGFGDPTLATPAYSRRYLGGAGGNIGKLARPLRDAGITQVSGPIVVDETAFDGKRRVPSWPARYNTECQPLSAMTVNQSWLGNEHRRYVKSPPRAAGNQLRFAMGAFGIKHIGAITVGRAPEQGRLLATVKSPPLRTISRLMLPDSDNFIAEMLTKDVGAYTRAEGSTIAGTDAAAASLGAIGVLQAGDRLVDGSGLSRDNRLTATTLVGLLSAAHTDTAWGTPLIDALPRGGEGTLKRRLRDIRKRVHAKTGYISGTVTLTGVVTSSNGTTYAFAFLMNQGSVGGARTTQDQLVRLLATGVADDSA